MDSGPSRVLGTTREGTGVNPGQHGKGRGHIETGCSFSGSEVAERGGEGEGGLVFTGGMDGICNLKCPK